MYKFDNRFYADVRIEDRFSTGIMYRNGILESSKTRNEKRAFIRVFDGNIWYYASTSEVKNVQTELNNLYKQATPSKNILDNPIVKKFQVNKDVLMKFENNSVRNVSLNEKQALVNRMLPVLNDSGAAMSVALYSDSNSVYEFYSSKGADIKYDYQLAGVVAAVAFATENDFVQNMFYNTSPFFNEINDVEDGLKDVIKESQEFVKNAKPCEKGKFPVVLSPLAAGIFAHESFGHKSESDFMLGDETMAKEWKLGKKVGSDLLSIVDCGADFGSGYVPYDDEGTKCEKTYLIKNGILTGRLHSATTAATLNEELTGNARAMDCKFEPIVRMTNTYIEGGNDTFEELVAGIKKGYFIKGVNHGSGMSTFTIAPSIAYEIVDGKIGAPVKISVITGNVFETLGLIDGVTKDVEINNSVTGGCGKMEQFPLHVAHGGPYVRVKEMNVQ